MNDQYQHCNSRKTQRGYVNGATLVFLRYIRSSEKSIGISKSLGQYDTIQMAFGDCGMAQWQNACLGCVFRWISAQVQK